MRIIGGKHRSRIIKYNISKNIRPTADNVREAVFNLLPDLDQLIVLDLFAGTGAYGLESLSRGAKFAYFNEIERKNLMIINENLKILNEHENAKVINMDFKKALNLFQCEHLNFDIIFIDPPYYKNYYEEVMLMIEEISKNETLIVVESDKSLDLSTVFKDFLIHKDKTYGKKRINICQIKK